jgi:hypothetical protein
MGSRKIIVNFTLEENRELEIDWFLFDFRPLLNAVLGMDGLMNVDGI